MNYEQLMTIYQYNNSFAGASYWALWHRLCFGIAVVFWATQVQTWSLKLNPILLFSTYLPVKSLLLNIIKKNANNNNNNNNKTL